MERSSMDGTAISSVMLAEKAAAVRRTSHGYFPKSSVGLFTALYCRHTLAATFQRVPKPRRIARGETGARWFVSSASGVLLCCRLSTIWQAGQPRAKRAVYLRQALLMVVFETAAEFAKRCVSQVFS